MLRKRTSFKPNLKQIATPVQPPTTTTTDGPQLTGAGPSKESQARETASTLPAQPSAQLVAPNPSLPDDGPVIADLQAATTIEQPPSQTTPNSNNIPAPQHHHHQQPTSNESDLSGVSSRRVQEAITILKGQKFEPIKSLSLRTSVNKNVKLKDLLFFNPPMTKDQKRHKKTIHSAKQDEKTKANSKRAASEQPESAASTTTTASATDIDREQTEEQASLAPKVKMGPGGKLVLDESSTVINRTNAIKEQEAIIEDHEDIISKTNYDSYRRKPSITSQTKWSLEDTKKFYRALTILGTDFSVMESLLFAGSRSRTELHKKFKREERVNKPKVDIALSNRISLNSEELEDLKEIFSK